MSEKRIFAWILGCTLLAGCAAKSNLEKGSNELAALSYLRKFQTASALYQTEYGRYADLPELYRDGSSGAVDYKFFMAWDGHDEPVPLFGHFFASVDPGYAAGRAKAMRAGLCAYPAKPGETGDLVICTFTSDAPEAPEPMGMGYVSEGGGWELYVAEARKMRHPPRSWPSAAELERSFARLNARTPEQGIADARQRVADALSGR